MSKQRDEMTIDPLERFIDAAVRPCAKLPPERAESLREELQSHLEALTEYYVSTGLSAGDAVNAALERMGNPRSIGVAYANKWLPPGERGTLLGALTVATLSSCVLIAIVVFIGAMATLYLNGPFYLIAFLSLIILVGPGMVTGLVAPRHAVTATGFVNSIWLGWYASNLYSIENQFGRTSTSPSLYATPADWGAIITLMILCSIFVACSCCVAYSTKRLLVGPAMLLLSRIRR